MAQNKSLSTQEVADILHVSKSTIYDLIRRGEIHSYKIGRKVRFTQDDVDAYIARSRHEHSTMPVKKVDTHSTLLTPEESAEPDLILAGQDVLLDILANYLQDAGIHAARTYLSSFESLLSLYQGKTCVGPSVTPDVGRSGDTQGSKRQGPVRTPRASRSLRDPTKGGFGQLRRQFHLSLIESLLASELSPRPPSL